MIRSKYSNQGRASFYRIAQAAPGRQPRPIPVTRPSFCRCNKWTSPRVTDRNQAHRFSLTRQKGQRSPALCNVLVSVRPGSAYWAPRAKPPLITDVIALSRSGQRCHCQVIPLTSVAAHPNMRLKGLHRCRFAVFGLAGCGTVVVGRCERPRPEASDQGPHLSFERDVCDGTSCMSVWQSLSGLLLQKYGDSYLAVTELA